MILISCTKFGVYDLFPESDKMKKKKTKRKTKETKEKEKGPENRNEEKNTGGKSFSSTTFITQTPEKRKNGNISFLCKFSSK